MFVGGLGGQVLEEGGEGLAGEVLEGGGKEFGGRGVLRMGCWWMIGTCGVVLFALRVGGCQ